MQCYDKQHSDNWKNVNGKITCRLHTISAKHQYNYSLEVCLLCYLQVQLENVKDVAESLPKTGSALYDDAVTDVFNAADNAYHLLEHEHGEE